MPLGSFQNGLGNVPDQIRIGPCGRRGPVSRISIAYPLLGHDSAEQVNYGIMVGHEAPLVLQLVEEDILAVDPDVRVSDLPVDRYLSLNLVFGIIFRYPKIRLAELAVAAASAHYLCQPPDPPSTSFAFGYFFRVLLISPTSSRNFLFVYAVSFPPSVNIILTGPRPIGSMVDIPIILVLSSTNLETWSG